MRSLRSSIAVAMILVGGGCAGGSFSSPDGPISFEFACKGWSVGWSEQTDPYVGVLSRGPDAEPGTGEPLADYLAPQRRYRHLSEAGETGPVQD